MRLLSKTYKLETYLVRSVLYTECPLVDDEVARLHDQLLEFDEVTISWSH